jgi:hypothetical protein
MAKFAPAAVCAALLLHPATPPCHSTSCFYRHAYPDGRLEEKNLRKAADEEGNITVVQPVRLSDFITISSAGQRLLGGGRRRRG